MSYHTKSAKGKYCRKPAKRSSSSTKKSHKKVSRCRKCPTASAKQFPVGKILLGKDHKKWCVKTRKNKAGKRVKTWVRLVRKVAKK